MPDKDYSGTPLFKKLGIKPEARVALLNAPRGFLDDFELPPAVDLVTRTSKDLDIAVLFVTRLSDLRDRFAALAEAVFPDGGLWIAYPKKSSTITTNLNFDNVQQLGLDAGLVDNKSCAVNDDYSGLRFVYRLTDR